MTENQLKASEQLSGEDWAGEMGNRWLANLDYFEQMIAPIGKALVERALFQSGERVIDIGSGGGVTTREVARIVAPEGEVLGLDVAPMLVAEAEKRRAEASIGNARFICADASTFRLKEPLFDRLVSRFGSMFFAEPSAAFANLKDLIKAKSRIDLAVWGPPSENPWMMEMMSVVRRHIEVPPADPRAPGPFAFGDLDYLNHTLASGGFQDVQIDPYIGKQAIGGAELTTIEVLDFVLSSLGVGRILDEASEAIRTKASEDLLLLFENHFSPGSGVVMNCKAWLVSARS